MTGPCKNDPVAVEMPLSQRDRHTGNPPARRARATYLSLVLFAVAFGWIEGSVVVYLRELYFHNAGPNAPLFPVVFLSDRLARVEVVREFCTMVLLAVVGWLASGRWAARIGSFLLLFGIWDLTYYGVLKLVLDWPTSLSTWDILFLIPRPWIAPIWAPASVATVFVGIGSYLFWTGDRLRAYRPTDAAVLFASAFTIVASFLADWKTAAEQQIPQHFHGWLFWAGGVLGIVWFVRVERRVATRPATAIQRPNDTP